MGMEWDFEEDVDTPRGRLVLIAERVLSDASKGALRSLLAEMYYGGHWQDDVTMVSGLTRASVLQAGRESGPLFYNHDYITPEQAFGLMPWREIWLVAGGKIWQLEQRR